MSFDADDARGRSRQRASPSTFLEAGSGGIYEIRIGISTESDPGKAFYRRAGVIVWSRRGSYDLLQGLLGSLHNNSPPTIFDVGYAVHRAIDIDGFGPLVFLR